MFWPVLRRSHPHDARCISSVRRIQSLVKMSSLPITDIGDRGRLRQESSVATSSEILMSLLSTETFKTEI
jgi:hypothetical protein